MNITRRRFIQNLSIAAVAAVLLGATGSVLGQTAKSDYLFPLPAGLSSDSLINLTKMHFECVF